MCPVAGDAAAASRPTPLALADQLSITPFRHPVRAREMRIMDGAATLRIAVWIKSEEDLNSLTPVSAISLGIEQAHVELHVLAII